MCPNCKPLSHHGARAHTSCCVRSARQPYSFTRDIHSRDQTWPGLNACMTFTSTYGGFIAKTAEATFKMELRSTQCSSTGCGGSAVNDVVTRYTGTATGEDIALNELLPLIILPILFCLLCLAVYCGYKKCCKKKKSKAAPAPATVAA